VDIYGNQHNFDYNPFWNSMGDNKMTEICRHCNGSGIEPCLSFPRPIGTRIDQITCVECDGSGEFVIEND
jgi:DnaJ-class molecular chaperone